MVTSWGCVDSLLVETFLDQDEIQGQLPLQLPQKLQLQPQLDLHYTNNYTYSYSCSYSYSDELLYIGRQGCTKRGFILGGTDIA